MHICLKSLMAESNSDVLKEVQYIADDVLEVVSSGHVYYDRVLVPLAPDEGDVGGNCKKSWRDSVMFSEALDEAGDLHPMYMVDGPTILMFNPMVELDRADAKLAELREKGGDSGRQRVLTARMVTLAFKSRGQEVTVLYEVGPCYVMNDDGKTIATI